MIGEFARTPRYQGAGSSQVNPTRLDVPLDALRLPVGEVPFAAGFTIAGGPSGADDELLDRGRGRWPATPGRSSRSSACPAPTSPRATTAPRLGPARQPGRRCSRAVAEVNPRVVVVLANGSAVSVPLARPAPRRSSRRWLGGQARRVGRRRPAARRRAPRRASSTETIPLPHRGHPRLRQLPRRGTAHVRYGEGVLVGYRWYDTRAHGRARPRSATACRTRRSRTRRGAASADGTDVVRAA